jgi:hypothetical protein
MPHKPKNAFPKASNQGAGHSARSQGKFIPNLTQINEAAKELPDPEIWPDANYFCPLQVNGQTRQLEFSLKSIKRGDNRTARWIYEGKILIRKRDT